MPDAPPADDGDLDSVKIGIRIREMRLGRRLTLRVVSERAGITEGFLSQIETGRSSPSLRTFRRIAAALGVDASEMLDGQETELPRLVPHATGRAIDIGAVSKYRISPPSLTNLEVLRGELTVGGDAGESYTHGDSDEVLIVLSGTVSATVDGTVYRMNAGDTLCYRSSMEHTIANAGEIPAEVVWVTSPPA